VGRLHLFAILYVAKMLALAIQRNIFITESGFFRAIHWLKALKAVGRRN